MTHTNVLAVDIASGMADVASWGGAEQVEVAVPCIVTEPGHRLVWVSSYAIPFAMDDWEERCVAQLATVRHWMDLFWPEVEYLVDWWLIEPGVDEDYPRGLEVGKHA